MRNDISIFRYKILGNQKPSKIIIKNINEELNRGLAFAISKTHEKVILIEGEWQGWVTTEIRGNNIYLYVDDNFFKPCVFEQILTSLWANLLDYGGIKLEEFQLSDKLHTSSISNIINKQSLNKLLGIDGPYFATVIKPSFLSLDEKLNIAERFASIGGVFIKEDETYLLDKWNLLKESDAIQRSINKISKHCFYIPNVTPYTFDKRFLNELYQIGIRIVMVNYLITGLPTINRILQKNNKILFWGHRVGYKAIDKYISMKALALLATYSGMSMLHIGTPLFCNNSTIRGCTNIINAIRKVNPNVTPVFTKTSPQIISFLVKSFGKKTIIMACGSIRTNGYLDWEKLKHIIEIGKGSNEK